MMRFPSIAAVMGAGLCAALIAAGPGRPARAATVTPGPPDGADFDQLLHGAAYSYAEGDMLTASNSVHRALALQPDDPQAEALRKLIEETPPEDQQQEDQQQQREKDQQEEQQKPDQQKEEQPKPENAPQEQEQQQEREQQPPAQPQPNEQQEADPAETAPKEPGQLTPEEARMLLDALRQLDKVLPIRPPEKGRFPAVLKDW